MANGDHVVAYHHKIDQATADAAKRPYFASGRETSTNWIHSSESWESWIHPTIEVPILKKVFKQVQAHICIFLLMKETYKSEILGHFDHF